MKSRLYGPGFEYNKSKLQRRLVVLILIATLACLVALLVGLAVISAGLHRRYQANTTTKKRILSFQFLGRRAVKDTRLRLLKQHLAGAITQLTYGIKEASADVQ